MTLLANIAEGVIIAGFVVVLIGIALLPLWEERT